MTGKRVSKAKIKAAIPGSGGIISQISKRTGYTWRAVKENIEADEELKHMLEDEEATIDDKRKKILEEVSLYSEPPKLVDDEVTVNDYAEVFGVNRQLAARRLKALMECGVMTGRSGVYDPRTGKIVNAYRLQEDVSNDR